MFRKQGWFILLIPLWFCGSSSFFYQEHLAEGVESLIDFLNKSYESINLITACFVFFIDGSVFGKEGLNHLINCILPAAAFICEAAIPFPISSVFCGNYFFICYI